MALSARARSHYFNHEVQGHLVVHRVLGQCDRRRVVLVEIRVASLSLTTPISSSSPRHHHCEDHRLVGRHVLRVACVGRDARLNRGHRRDWVAALVDVEAQPGRGLAVVNCEIGIDVPMQTQADIRSVDWPFHLGGNALNRCPNQASKHLTKVARPTQSPAAWFFRVIIQHSKFRVKYPAPRQLRD